MIIGFYLKMAPKQLEKKIQGQIGSGFTISLRSFVSIESPKEKTVIRAPGRRCAAIDIKIRQSKREEDNNFSSKCSIPLPIKARDCRGKEEAGRGPFVTELPVVGW